MDFGGFDSSIMIFVKGWNSHVHREFPMFESSNVSRDSVSREIGLTANVPPGGSSIAATSFVSARISWAQRGAAPQVFVTI